MKKASKEEAEERINKFLKNIKNKSRKEIKNIKRIAMKHNIKLKEKKKKFCKYCYSPNLKVLSIKKNVKRVECKDCGKIMGWRIDK